MDEIEIRKELEAARRALASGENILSAREDIICGDVLLAENNLRENRNLWEIAGLARELMEQASVLEGYDICLTVPMTPCRGCRNAFITIPGSSSNS